MSSFIDKSPLDIGERSSQWLTTKVIRYESDVAGRVIEIPAGFETDLASIPRSFTALIPVNGKHRNAAIVHDYLYVAKPDWCNRSMADSIFLEAMEVLGEVRWRRMAMYSAVRVGGWLYWRKCSKCEH
ncbi:DUF1353 domain-containing protein [Cellvibrio sp. KY-GH-1]|uniref:DUF1353 domain-containing protein n=1 Tax=Cellvibrio sp. KY-GH-1 TaxID=2303332 RepID=UPI001246347A|nr:DUF1353 domain-containing protein [Cellvibrio sp. KY-GH-1]QEY15479.1 DUF1353 domain-containing protein [Cellvibrio sp. KY-GH-1]